MIMGNTTTKFGAGVEIEKREDGYTAFTVHASSGTRWKERQEKQIVDGCWRHDRDRDEIVGTWKWILDPLALTLEEEYEREGSSSLSSLINYPLVII